MKKSFFFETCFFFGFYRSLNSDFSARFVRNKTFRDVLPCAKRIVKNQNFSTVFQQNSRSSVILRCTFKLDWGRPICSFTSNQFRQKLKRVFNFSKKLIRVVQIFFAVGRRKTLTNQNVVCRRLGAQSSTNQKFFVLQSTH